MKSREMRQKFFDFFVNARHEPVASSSLIPAQDPTILFTNAGMNQFKDVFLGKEKRSYSRAVSIQKCMRAGGKHNDLDNVGFTARHLTFFEMMGNFSFGDYFKREAIRFSWDFLTKSMQFDPKTLYASVYYKDDESYDLWHKEIGVPTSRIVKLGEADNFWQMGDTGPCGPCSEIYVDRGEIFGCGKKECAPGCSCDRFLEVWNLVFMQYDRQADGTLSPLKQVGVDTGMGLERLAMLAEQKNSVFETDVFAHVIATIETLTGKKYHEQSADLKAAFHVLVDHSRACSFLIADGASPANEGRGYVLRKIIRRAALFSKKLTPDLIFPSLVDAVIEDMGTIYKDLSVQRTAIIRILTNEIEKFDTNLLHGQHIIAKFMHDAGARKIITGQQAFKLYDTYGFPLEITKIIAHEHAFVVDVDGFERCMDEQRERSGKKEQTMTTIQGIDSLVTRFIGYDHLKANTSIIGLIHDNALVNSISKGQQCWVVTDESPFYVEKGGQVSDQGVIIIEEHAAVVKGLKRIENAICALIEAPVNLKVGSPISALVDRQLRFNTMYNHTATHLLQAALIKVLGSSVRQSGSLVHPDYLRFDFTYHETLTPDQIKEVEDIVNEKIRENIPLSIYTTSYKQALANGVTAIFGEKYNPEDVRVIDIPNFSAELCGGTHVKATGDIGCFKITESSALSAGQRRIVALTGPKAMELFQQDFALIKTLNQEFKVQTHDLHASIQKLRDQYKQTAETLKNLKKKLWRSALDTWIQETELINNMPVLVLPVDEYSIDEMKEILQELLRKKPGLYILINNNDRASFVCGPSKEYASRVDLSKLTAWLKKEWNLQGGGKDMIQGGGPVINVAAFRESLKKFIVV
jgi:alanyl-tRNA synthetase